jgi:ribosome recycling factor
MVSAVIKKAQEDMNQQFSKFREEKLHMPMHLLGRISLNYYGSNTTLNQLSNITFDDAREIRIVPFDKSVLSSIKDVLDDSGLKCRMESNMIFLSLADFPPSVEFEKQCSANYLKEVKRIFEHALNELRETFTTVELSKEECLLRDLLIQSYERIGIYKNDDDDFFEGAPVRNPISPSGGATGASLTLPPPEEPGTSEDTNQD